MFQSFFKHFDAEGARAPEARPAFAADGDRLRVIHRARLGDWARTAQVLDLYVTEPDSPAGARLLDRLDADSLDAIAPELNPEMPTVFAWRAALATHPRLDKATAMSLFLRLQPQAYEAMPEAEAARHGPALAVLDALLARFRADDFASARLAYRRDTPPGNRRLHQAQAELAGAPCRWALPAPAFRPTAGQTPAPRLELRHGECVMVAFADWLGQRPDPRAAAAAATA